jgi:hypothetical protein
MRLPARGLARLFLCGSLAAGATIAATAKPADAFCGFYVSGADAKLFNNATQVVLMREGTRTVLSMANNYEGPSSNFAMVVPVPVVLQKENVRTLPRAVFAKVDQLDAPRLVEYWEQDPCAPEPMYERKLRGGAMPASAGTGGAGAKDDLGVKVEAQFTVGEYEIVILSAKDAAGLDTWLKQEKYKIPEGSEPYFRPYVQQGSKFFVARVDVSKVQKDDKGHEMLSPLRFHYDSEQFSLPVRLGLVNSKGTQDLIVHVLAKNQRYELANYPNAFIPTNLDVSENARGEFGSFYAALYDKTLEKNPKAVVTEYSWDASTCDPCPGPALDGNDLATLGADVLPGTPAPESKGGRRGGWFPSGFTITRLHARYTKESLGEDLVFRAAPAVIGGREVRSYEDAGTEGALEHGATPTAGYNNFQGRYAIRHPWGGPVTCKEPHRGRWGGPPAGTMHAGDSGPKPAKDLAFVPRDVPLGTFLRSEIPELGAKAEGAKVSAVLPPSVDAGATSPMMSSAPAPSSSAPSTSGAQPGTKSGCGCEVGPRQTGSSGAALALLYCAVGAVRRRRTAKIEQTHGNLTSSPQKVAPADS